MLYHILDIFFVVFHSSLILFNLFGFVWKKTRLLNLITLLLTGASWLFLGMITGSLGYCPLTDWHFNILEKLGKTSLPDSYIKYLTERVTGLDFPSPVIDKITLYAFLAALVCSAYLNFRHQVLHKRA
ncbi:MAG TPA: DUF2784 family protein [Bacteroidales bacterium]|nr:DUF2784 family protein [Bacteroidales bacterium]